MDAPWILIIEDNVDDADLVLRALKKADRQERPVVCTNADEAWALLKQSETTPHVVLLDAQLPGMPGTEFVACLRQEPQTQLLPVVVFTGLHDPKVASMALLRGANSCVYKNSDYARVIDDIQTIFRYWIDLHRSPVPLGKVGEPD